MSQWFDILYRSPGTPPPPDPVAETPPVDASPAAPPPLPGEGGNPLQATPPLQGIPDRWRLEIQKVAFHLQGCDAQARGQKKCLLFSAPANRTGTTTICYLVAHHLATELHNKKVLHIDFSTSRSKPAHAGVDAHLQIGDALPRELLAGIDKTLTRISIRPNGDQSVAAATAWSREFMAAAKEHCDWILIDSPPFFAAPETYAIAKASDGVVLVLRSGETRYPALNGLVADLASLGIPLVGSILNFRQFPIPRWLLKYI